MTEPPPSSQPAPVMALDYFEKSGRFRASILRSLAWVEMCYASVIFFSDGSRVFYLRTITQGVPLLSSGAFGIGLMAAGIMLCVLQFFGGILLYRGAASAKAALNVWAWSEVAIVLFGFINNVLEIHSRLPGMTGFVLQSYITNWIGAVANAGALPAMTLIILKQVEA